MLQIIKRTGWLAALLAIVSVAALACSSGAPTVTSTALPATQTPTLAQATATPEPGATSTPDNGISTELAAFLAEVDSKVAAIRGIPVASPVPFRFLNSQELNAYVRAQINDQETRDEIALAEGLYAVLGLIPADMDLFDAYSALLDSQVLGAYDPEVEEFVVLQKGDSFGASQEMTYAHEYVHRLQDARYGLDGITESLEHDSDRSFAFTALVEGDATTSQQIYVLQNFTFEQLSEVLAESSDAVSAADGTPYFLRRGLEFPYIEGATFVDGIRTRLGLDALEAAFRDPPDSSEQVLHFDKFVSNEQPVAVALPETLFGEGGAAGAGWELVDTDVLGEAFLKLWLEAIGARTRDAAEAAAGWGGDQEMLAKNANGDYAFAAKIVWDNPELDADQFFIALTTIMAASPEFLAVSVGPVGEGFGVKAYEGDGGVIVVTTFANAEYGEFTAVTAAPEIGTAMSLLLALAG